MARNDELPNDASSGDMGKGLPDVHECLHNIELNSYLLSKNMDKLQNYITYSN